MQTLVVGNLTQKTRKLRVVNMLLSSSHVIDVCAEQKISDINDLYRSYELLPLTLAPYFCIDVVRSGTLWGVECGCME